MKASYVPIKQTGGAIVEFIFVLPLLLLLMLATAEFGHAFYQYNTLTKAVRNGTRYLADNVLTNTTGVINISEVLRTETRNMVICGKKDCTDIDPLVKGFDNPEQVNVEPVTTGGTTKHIQVTAAYVYEPILFPDCLPTFIKYGPQCKSGKYGFDLDFTLSASAIMRVLL